ncbi:hypothetical protein B0H10DRAFT_1976581 [Mycena sp. CBHHK59/15]|nr:hypothetical protein B0H10DRAFT_1976581 [Mycena sp. CBHHK59/15]
MTHQMPGLGNDRDDDEKQSVDSSASTAVNDLHHVEELWFEDDTLILRAEDSLFRVSKGVLSARSPVMKAMFSGMPKSGGDILYGCPVVDLHHSASDVTYFLKAIFDLDFFLPPPAESPFWVVIGVIRLAHEYNVRSLLRRGLMHLETFYPSVLDGQRAYDTIEEGSERTRVLHRNLVALQVASELGALWNLPRIIYECCTFSLTDILDSEGWEDLPAIHKRTIILSHDQQKYGASRVSQFLLANVSQQCKSTPMCNSAKLLWLKTVDNWRKGSRDSIPLEFWDESDWEDMAHDFCQSCLAKSKEYHAFQRTLLWKALPKAFGLLDWDELEKLKTEMFCTN